jgi:nucleotide-binding universal stress UspA family protein
MTANDRDVTIRRILVALDSSPESRALLDLAVDLAECLGSSVLGLFVEDQDILDFTDMPIARQVSSTGLGVCDLTREHMESHYRSQAAAVRRAVESAAAQRRIECAFETRRGKTEVEIGSVARAWDLIAISATVGHVTPSRRIDLFANLAPDATGLLTLAGLRTAPGTGPVTAVYTASPAADGAVSLAARIAARWGEERRIVFLGNGDKDDPATARDAERQRLPAAMSLAAYLGATQPRLIVLPADLSDDDRQAVAKLGFPVLVVTPKSA